MLTTSTQAGKMNRASLVLPAKTMNPKATMYVMMVNQLQMNITNHGLIGSQYTETFPYSRAPSGQWPAGSGIEYLWSGGLWVGGIIHDDKRVSTGQYERELRPGLDIWSTIYEARNHEVTRPAGLVDTGGLVSAEEHLATGGLGSAISEVLSEFHPTPLRRVGIRDTFGLSGKPDDLLKHFGLTAEDIMRAAFTVIKKKERP